jgi:hypothetical protein
VPHEKESVHNYAHAVTDLAERARRIRLASLRMVHAAKMGHPGGDLSCADILATLFFHTLTIDAAHPQDPAHDRSFRKRVRARGVHPEPGDPDSATTATSSSAPWSTSLRRGSTASSWRSQAALTRKARMPELCSSLKVSINAGRMSPGNSIRVKNADSSSPARNVSTIASISRANDI